MAGTAAVAFTLALVFYTLWPDGDSRPIAWQDLRAGRLTITGETKRVFRDEAALRRYLTGAGGRVPDVDFARNQVLLVSPGPRSSTGHRVEVESVSERDGKVTVTVRERTPAIGERVEPHVTFPYRLLSLPAGKDVYVNWPGRSPG